HRTLGGRNVQGRARARPHRPPGVRRPKRVNGLGSATQVPDAGPERWGWHRRAEQGTIGVMDQVELLEYSLAELRDQVVALDDDDLDVVSNCDAWSVRQLASHALNNQLLWAGLVTGNVTVSVEDTMGGVPIDGDLTPVARDVCERTLTMWRTPGV